VQIPVEDAFEVVDPLLDTNYITGRMPYFGVSSVGVPLTAVVNMETGTIIASELDGPVLTASQIVTLAEEANTD
jgi:hypothetical protein